MCLRRVRSKERLCKLTPASPLPLNAGTSCALNTKTSKHQTSLLNKPRAQVIFQSFRKSFCSTSLLPILSTAFNSYLIPSASFDWLCSTSTNHIARNHQATKMGESTGSMDLKIQIAFGLFGILSLAVAIASVHPQNSLGAAWYRSVRASFRGTRRRTHQDSVLILDDSMVQEDDESSIGITRISSIEVDIPSSRLSLDEFPLQAINTSAGVDNLRRTSEPMHILIEGV
jgi:hypothetical protein